MLSQLLSVNLDAADIVFLLSAIIFGLVSVYQFMHNAPIEGAKALAFVLMSVGFMLIT